MKRLVFIAVIIALLFVFYPVMSGAVDVGPKDLGVPSSERQLTEESDYWPDGHVRVSRRYDSTGDLVEVDYYRENGTLQQSEVYGKYGHKVKECYYTSSGKLKENADGWAMMTWKYDNGNLIEQSYYDDDGKVTERKEYNKEGDLIAKNYYGNTDPDPAEEYEPEPDLAGETITYSDME